MTTTETTPTRPDVPAVDADAPHRAADRSDLPSTKGRPVSEAAPLPDVPVPDSQAGIDELRAEIDRIDAALIDLVLRRTAVSHAIGTARKTLGGPRIVYSREMEVLERFRPLGPSGTDFGMLLLAMGRGRMGRR